MIFNKFKLEDITDKIGDGIHGTPEYDDNGEFYFVNGNNLVDGDIVFKNDTKKINEEQYLKHKRNLNRNTLLISINGTLGNIAKYNNEKIILGKSACYVNVKDEYNVDYVYFVFESSEFKKYLQYGANGTTIKNVPLSAIRNYEISIPSKENQDKIVKVLKSIEDKIKLNNKLNNNLLEQNKSLYNEWFVNFNFEYNEKKYKESNGEMINSEYGLIPKNWSFKRIDEMNLDISDGNYSSKYPTKQEFKDEGIPFIRGTDFVGYSISKKSLMFITPEKHSILKKGHLKKNDILITTRGEIGRIAFVSDDFIDANINAQLIRINGGSIYPRSFLGTALISEYIQNDIQSLVTGTALQQLPVGKFNQIKFLIPDDHKIIEKFDDFAENNLKLIQANEKENELLEQLRDTLLPKLMNGEIDLDNIEI